MSQQKQRVKEYLQRSDMQLQIKRAIQGARSNVTMTISRVARLSGFSESRLREWEKRGLLRTERLLSEKEGKDSTGHRQYSQVELEKLIVIRSLLDEGYSVGDIPSDLETIWQEIAESPVVTGATQTTHSAGASDASTQKHLSIDESVESMDRDGFWRYFVSQALRISLSLICEDVPDTVAGLILPLDDRKLSRVITVPADLHRVGVSLVGWLAKNRSFYTFLDEAPTFKFPTDYRLETLPRGKEQAHVAERVLDNVFILVQREARPLSLSPELVETLQRLLGLLYARVGTWQSDFDYAMYSWFYQAHDLERVSREKGDVIFNSLLERAIELDKDSKRGWLFSALLLPDDSRLPIQQQRLVVRAQTRESPYEIGMTSTNPQLTDSLSLKAFQSGQVVYFSETLPGHNMITYQQPPSMLYQETTEALTRSAIAIPLLGDYGLSIAVLYIAAAQMNAFSLADQRVLRVIAGIVEELLVTSQARHEVVGRAGNMVVNPGQVDTTFQDFASETDFIAELESMLSSMQQNPTEQETLSLISIDLDNQSGIAMKYGNRAARKLSQLMGIRVKGQMGFVGIYASGKLFHLSADRYCLVLRGISLEETRQMAVQLQGKLRGEYLVNAAAAALSRPVLPEDMLKLPDVKVHLGVAFYKPSKLIEKMEQYSVAHARALIVAGIEEELEQGKSKGGDCIITWDPNLWTYVLLAEA